MNNYDWFKFSITDWMMGRIQKESPEIRASFIDLLCHYWKDECNLSIEKAELLTEVEHVKRLIDRKLIGENNGNIVIKFLDKQREHVTGISQTRSEIGSKGGQASAKQRQANASNNEPIANQLPSNSQPIVKQNEADKNREEENRIDKKRKDKNNKKTGDKSPEYNEFLEKYFKWFESKYGVKPQFDGSDGKALKTLIKYLKENSAGAALDSFEYILRAWDRLDDFTQKQNKIRQIGSNINSIIHQLKVGKNGKGQRDYTDYKQQLINQIQGR